MAYPQAKAPRPTYMELPTGVQMSGLNRRDHCLLVERNIYGGMDAGRTWFLFMRDGLIKLGFKQSSIDECVFYRGTTIFIVYTDDGILLSPFSSQIDKDLVDMRTLFDIEDQGDLQDYLGVKVVKASEGEGYRLTQPHLIDSILRDLGLIDLQGRARNTAKPCLLYTSPSPRDGATSRMPSSA